MTGLKCFQPIGCIVRNTTPTIVDSQFSSRLYIGKHTSHAEVERPGLIRDLLAVGPEQPLPNECGTLKFSDDASVARNRECERKFPIRPVRKGTVKCPTLEPVRPTDMLRLCWLDIVLSNLRNR